MALSTGLRVPTASQPLPRRQVGRPVSALSLARAVLLRRPVLRSCATIFHPPSLGATVTCSPAKAKNPDNAVPALEAKIRGGHKKLSLLPLIFLIFFEVAGGPYGAEPAVQSVGTLYAPLGFLIFPFIWAIPEALVTAELYMAMPGNDSFVLWADLARVPAGCCRLWRPLAPSARHRRNGGNGFFADAAGTIGGGWLKY